MQQILVRRGRRSILASLSVLIAVLIGASLTPAAASDLQRVDDAPTIAFLNPTPGTSLIVSDKPAADAAYRILAWVDNAASGSVVEFELQAEGERPVTVGLATRGSDTFQYLWSLPASIEDGTYVLRALLFTPTATGVEQVGQDEETISIDRSADTVDMLYPTVGGAFGTFTAAGRSPTGVIDVATSSGAGSISAFYSTTPPGSGPQWQLCGTETRAEAEDGVRCTLQGTSGAEIRAVATVAHGSGTADATKVSLPYEQTAESFIISSVVYDVSSYSDGTFPCSAPVTAELLDQFGRPIAGANVDVHAFGPSDQLSFDTGTQSAPGTVASPNDGHGTLEPGYACSGSPGAPLAQAEHNAPALADTKHAESTVGTSDRGRFEVRLHSDTTGSTELTMWADVNDDDTMGAEKNATARIEWNIGDQPPPKRQLVERDVTLIAGDRRVTKGRRVQMSGAVVSEDSTCMALQVVALQRRWAGTETRYKTIKQLTTDETGAFATRVRVRRTSEYRVVAPANEICARAVSRTVKVRLRG